MSATYMSLLVLLINALTVRSQRYGEYIQAYEAKGRTLRYNSTTLRCYGYHSCEEAKIGESVSQYRETTECLGYGGCINAQQITTFRLICGPYGCHNAQSITAGTAFCDGRNSCSKNDKMAADNVYCYGSQSCKDTTINSRSDDTGHAIRCIGDNSCFGATISAQQVSITGTLAAGNAKLDSFGVPTMNVISTGSHGLFNADFFCKSSECTLTCDGTGCFGAHFFCYAGSKCTVYPIRCRSGETIDGTSCPFIYRATSLEEDMKFNEYIETKNIDGEHTQYINKNESLCSEGIDNDEMNRND